MPWRGILRYTTGALLFALGVCGLWLMLRRMSRRPWTRRDALALAAVGYLAALMQITGLRLGLRPVRWLGSGLHPVPLRTTLSQWRLGPGAFAYHVLGNLAWFVPLGLLLPRLRPRCRWHQALLAGAALSAFAEALQYLLGTGISDVDDVLLNALGALLGWELHRLTRRGAR